jgi:hypothetical protein
VWRPYGDRGTEQARRYYSQVRGGLPGELSETVWVNPADLLAGYLRQPDAERWQWRAEAALAGLVKASGRGGRPAPGSAGGQILAALRGNVPENASGQAGPVQVVTATDASGCRLVCAADGREKPPVWTALVLLDDTAAAHADEDAHKRRWQAWLYWSNLLQFLEHGGGDGVQLAVSVLEHFESDALAVAGGGGLLESVRTELLPVEAPTTHQPSGDSPPRDAAWVEALELIDPDEPGLAALAGALADHSRVPAPEVGYELDAHGGWMAELAWPAARVGVVLAPRPQDGQDTDPEAADRDKASRASGWVVRPATDWGADGIADALDS